MAEIDPHRPDAIDHFGARQNYGNDVNAVTRAVTKCHSV
jgi:hypothetical protein